MRIEDASKKLKFHNDLLGRSLSGASIDELIIAPTDMDLRQQFEKLYVSSLDAQMAIKPFIAEDVDVWWYLIRSVSMNRECLFPHH